MKKRIIALIFILALITIPAGLLLGNFLISRHYDKTYAGIDQGASTATYSIEEILVPGNKIEYHFASSRAVEGEHDSHIFYNSHYKYAILQTEEYRHSDNGSSADNIFRHFLRVDATGKVIADQEERDSLIYDAVLLKNELKPFQKWSDASQKIHLKHFGKRKFYFECLNPFSGFGNPTGGKPCYIWDGDGYYNISFKNEMLKVKIPCETSAIFSSADHEYRTGLYYYELPDEDLAFLIYAKMYEPHRFYMIKKKS